MSASPLPVRIGLEALRASLPHAVAARLRSAAELGQALAAARPEAPLATGLPSFDQLLGGGLPRGRLVELVGRRPGGRFAIVVAALAAATAGGEAAALVDLGDGLDPRAAEEAGADLARILWLRPRRFRHALAATEITIGAGFPLVVLDLGVGPVVGRAPAAAWLRLARTAEAHESALLLSTPFRASGAAAVAVVSLFSARADWRGHGRSPRVLAGVGAELVVEKLRGTSGGEAGRLLLQVPGAIGGTRPTVTGELSGLTPFDAEQRALRAGGRRG